MMKGNAWLNCFIAFGKHFMVEKEEEEVVYCQCFWKTHYRKGRLESSGIMTTILVATLKTEIWLPKMIFYYS